MKRAIVLLIVVIVLVSVACSEDPLMPPDDFWSNWPGCIDCNPWVPGDSLLKTEEDTHSNTAEQETWPNIGS